MARFKAVGRARFVGRPKGTGRRSVENLTIGKIYEVTKWPEKYSWLQARNDQGRLYNYEKELFEVIELGETIPISTFWDPLPS